MGVNPSNAIAERDHGPVFSNMAGHPNPDSALRAELCAAGIPLFESELLRDGQAEVNTSVQGSLFGWGFRRAWYYWAAKGPGIPPNYAWELHKSHGREVRINGHCGCPDPGYMKGFAVGTYHIDTQRGLQAMADMLKRITKDHEAAEAARQENPDGQ